MPFLSVDEAPLWYRDADGDGMPVVLLHASAGDSSCWVGQAEAFDAAGVRLVAFDRRGHGRSRTTVGHAVRSTAADDLGALVAALGLDDHVVVGHAAGGFAALDYAADRPSGLRGLVLSQTLAAADAGFLAGFDARHAGQTLAATELGASYRRRDPAGVRRFLAMVGEGAYDRPQQPTRQPLTVDRAREVAVPTLVIGGGEDVVAPLSVVTRLAGAVTGARLEVIADAGHSGYWECPTAWNELVLGFVGDLRS